MEYTKLKNINNYKSESINPAKMPDTVFEMYSVPIYETGHPEYLRGDEIASNKAVVMKNDILLCKINPRINRVWVVGDESEHLNIASSEWIVVRNEQYNPEYLAWYFRSPKFQKLMVSEVTGIGGSLTRAQPKCVAEYSVPVLDRKEQDEIVNILNKCKFNIDSRNQELLKLDNLIKARFVEMFGGQEFERKQLIDLIQEGAGLSYGIVVPGDNVGDGIPMVRPSDFKNGRLNLDNVYRVALDIECKYKKTRLLGDEILVQVIGQPGQVMLSDERCKGMNVTRNLAVIRIDKNKADRLFISHYLTTEEAQRFMFGSTNQSTLKQLPLNKLKELPVPMVPISEQVQFADFVKQVDKSKVADIIAA